MTSIGGFSSRTLGDIVRADARTAAVLDRYGLDYCCGGRQTLADACHLHALDPDVVAGELASLGVPSKPAEPAEAMGLDALTRYIIDVHHRYVRESAPQIRQWLARLVERHADRYPELVEVRSTFDALAVHLETHLAKEEALLFPAIEQLARADRVGGTTGVDIFATVLHPMRVMEDDHVRAGALLGTLRDLTHGFAAPDDACGTHRACYAALARFERDLHLHIHLESNVLFPRALATEQRLA